jgi:tRNA pseudouridine55 synthase
MHGILVVDKPVGPTSHDVVSRVRRALRERRIGHTGTLDPAASGVLPLAIGRATRLVRFLSAGPKTYDADIVLGVSTDTFDADGSVTATSNPDALPTRAEIERALDRFRGTFRQQPPEYSAKRIAGERSYRLARLARRTVEQGPRAPGVPSPVLRPVDVSVFTLELLDVTGGRVALRVECSPGFYVRSLAHDLGQVLGVGGHLATLRRTRTSEFTLAAALPLDAIEADPERAARAILPLSAVLQTLAAARLTLDGVRRARHGRDLRPDDMFALPQRSAPWVRLLDPAGDLIGLAQLTASGALHPSVVLM